MMSEFYQGWFITITNSGTVLANWMITSNEPGGNLVHN